MNVENKIKNIVRKKNHNVFKGFKGGPFEHPKTFFRKIYIFFFTFIKNAFYTNSRFFPQKYARN